MQTRKIGVIVGSLRKASYARMLSNALIELAPSSMTLAHIEIGDLPHYNEDLETGSPPAAWTTFRAQVIACDGLLFVTPEYNRSIPGVLKNAIDVGSRPWGKSAWSGKPAAVASSTPGALGAMASHHHLRQILYAVNLSVMAYPEVYVPAAGTLFDERGRLTNGEVREFLGKFMVSFASWMDKVGGPPRST